MKLKLKINESTTDSELVHLGMFFTALGMNRGAHVVSAPTDEAEYTVIIPPTNTTEQELRDGELGKIEGINILTGKPEPKRRRRTKEEIAAAEAAAVAAAAAAAAAAQDSGAMLYWSHPESESFGIVIGRAELDKVLASDPITVEVTKEQYLALVEAKAKAEIAAAEDAAKAEAGKDQPAPTQPAQETGNGAAETPATEAPSDTKTYTPAEVQKIAVATAGRFGPEKVKAIIAQYPGAARIADLPLTELAGFVAKLNAVS